MGRIGKLTSPISVTEAVERVKRHLGIEHVRLAKGINKSWFSNCSPLKIQPIL
jgi:ribosomal protein L31E